MGLEKIVNVQISRQTSGVSQAGFGTPLILGPNGDFDADEVRSYSSLAAVADDYETTHDEYKMAAKIFSQNPKLPTVKIGQSEIVAQVVTYTVTVTNDAEYSVNFGTVEEPDEYSYIADSSTSNLEIVEGLKRIINGEEVQTIDPASAPSSGTIKIHFGTDNVTVNWNDNATALQTAIRTLTGLEGAIVTGTLATSVEVVFRGYSGDASLLATSQNTLSDGSPVAVAVAVSVEGEARAHGVIASGSTTLILTADTAGDPFEAIVSGNLAGVESEASGSIEDAILAAEQVDPDWYFLLLTSTDESVIESAAETIEAMRKLLLIRTDDEDGPSAATDDLLSTLRDANYFRTAPFFKFDITDYPEAGLVGRCGPLNPGSETWANKTIAGVAIDSLTDSQQTYLDDKNTNYYVRIGGVAITQNGKTSGGEYIDVIRFIDWLQARMQEAIFAKIVRLDKIPFTDPGIGIIENEMRAVLHRGVVAGGIASDDDFTVTVPLAADISDNDKAERRLTGLKFTAVLAGAIHAVEIQGEVTL